MTVARLILGENKKLFYKTVTIHFYLCLWYRLFTILENQANIILLINQCKVNNKKAQFEIYKLYYKAMFNVSFRILNNQELAEDIMQESFLTAFTKLDTFIGNVTFGAWLKKIVINKSINEYQNNNKYIFSTLDETKLELKEELKDDFENINTEKVIKSLLKIKEDYRIIITLHFIEGYDLKEISEILNITYENCRTKMSRAKESLRLKLKTNES